MTRSFLLILSIAACALGCRAALAENLGVQDERIDAIVAGTTMGVFFHEFAHAMIGELKLPATGPEEDTADEFSAWVLANWVRGKADSFLIKMTNASPLFWYYSARERDQAGQPHRWQGEHAPDIRRFRHTFCMLYGADPFLYGSLADQVEFSLEDKHRCINDYPKHDKAWTEILMLRARNLGSDRPGTYPANTPGGQIELAFQPTQSPYGHRARELLNKFLEEKLRELSRQYVWPRNLRVEFRDCGEINAKYYSDTGTISICYEFIEHASLTVLRGENIAAPRLGQQAMAFVQGAWWARVNTESGLLDMRIIYNPDQTYRSDETWTQTGHLAARVTGAWSVQPAGPNQLMIHRNPTQLHPREFCNNLGYCRPHTRRPAGYPVQIINQDTMNVNGVVWTRMR